jgi:hypothetical protein
MPFLVSSAPPARGQPKEELYRSETAPLAGIDPACGGGTNVMEEITIGCVEKVNMLLILMLVVLLANYQTPPFMEPVSST